MARYTAEQIYAFAREAGFSPDRAATMTAVAMAESGGNSTAHNPVGENSKGLWQINARAHPKLGESNLFDPVQNAKAAFAVSKGGADISPWTTTHGGLSARYLRFRSQAEQAAVAYGDGPGHGVWTGSPGYGHPVSAGDPQGGGQGVHKVEQPATPAPANPSQNPSPSVSPTTTSASDNVNVVQPAVSAPGQLTSQAGTQFGIAFDDKPLAPGQTAQAGAQFGIPFDDQLPAVQAAPPVVAVARPAPALQTPAPQQPQPQPQPGPQQPKTPGDGTKLKTFLDSAKAQSGDRYVFGAETKMNDPNPNTFDCSELVEWASHQAGVKVPDGAWAQYQFLHKGNNQMSVEQAIKTPGALLFSFSSDPTTGKPAAAHVAISLGNGKTIEAKGTQYGVGSWEANTKRFTYAGMIPEMSVGAGAPPAGAPPAGAPPAGAAHVSEPPPAQPSAQPSAKPPAAPDAFTHRVNNDPARMDKQPAALEASQQLTAAAPPPAPHPPMPDLVPHAPAHEVVPGAAPAEAHHEDSHWTLPGDHAAHPVDHHPDTDHHDAGAWH